MWTMRTFRHLVLPLLLVLLATQARAGDEPIADYPSQRWVDVFTDHVAQASSKQAVHPLYQTSLIPTYFAPPVASSRLRDLAPETDQPRTHGVLSSTTWLSGGFVTEAELARSQGGAGWLQSGIPGDTRDTSQRMVRLGLTGTTGPVRYGMRYRSAGQAFLNGPDQAQREAWGEWTFGRTTLRTTIGQQWNNVDGDSTRTRLEQTYGRAGLAWKPPDLPELTLTYARNSLSSALEPLNIAPQRSLAHTLESALAYTSISWNARLASSYSLGNDLLRKGADTTVRMHMVTAAFRPVNTLTISPGLGYREEVQDWSGVRILSPSASVAMQYRQSQRLLISAMGNYAGTRSSDGLIDTEQVGGKGILAWNFHGSPEGTTLISLEAGYQRITNHVTPSTDGNDISGLIRIVVATL